MVSIYSNTIYRCEAFDFIIKIFFSPIAMHPVRGRGVIAKKKKDLLLNWGASTWAVVH